MKELTVISLLLLIVATFSAGCDDKSANAQGTIIPFDDSRIIIEVNFTDGDSGIQIFVDGEGWTLLNVSDPDGNNILDVMGENSVGLQGITELFFESAEPSFDDLPLDEFLERFPEGEYEFIGMTVEGDELVGSAELTHILPCGPQLTMPEEDADVDPESVVLGWELVTTVINSDGECVDSDELEIVRYQVIVEEDDVDLPRVFSIDLPPSATSVGVPPEFFEPGTDYKFEVITIEESGNQTISERAFATEE